MLSQAQPALLAHLVEEVVGGAVQGEAEEERTVLVSVLQFVPSRKQTFILITPNLVPESPESMPTSFTRARQTTNPTAKTKR